MQLGALTGNAYEHATQPGVFESEPEVGYLPEELRQALVAALRRHTTTPDRCWFAVWEGYGGLGHDVRSGATFDVPGRRYYVLAGPIECVAGFADGPNLWWPDDRAWCVATEVDLNTTYIGGSEACSRELVERPELEALQIDPSSGITFDSDPVNPPPPRHTT
jgi:hypothetical protein